MGLWFTVLTIAFIVISAAMVLIILVQRPSGGGLAGAFGGAGGSSSDTVFGGRVGDALTLMTVGAFVLYLGLAIALNLMDTAPSATAATPAVSAGPEIPADATTLPPITPPADSGGDSPIDGGDFPADGG
ncbi:MAG: preprotein translocase subunit SecG [Planctomycetota bacterium]|jgi:preprotein translocase subunit SecG